MKRKEENYACRGKKNEKKDNKTGCERGQIECYIIHMYQILKGTLKGSHSTVKGEDR